MARTAVSSARTVDRAAAPLPRAQQLILVVERDLQTRELEAHFLRLAGYSVEVADDGEMALDKVHALRPAAVVTEILVPKIGGLTLCRQLKADPQTAGIGVLVFSILSAAVRAREAGADAFLTKPLAEKKFLTAIDDLLSRAHRTTNHQTAKESC